MDLFTSTAWTLLALGFGILGLRILLWAFYRPTRRAPHDALPRLAVVIPAYNEGEMVKRSIRSVLSSRYPHAKLRIIVVDDGSTDDTAHHIAEVVQTANDGAGPKITTIRLEKNRGKRHALYTGFVAADDAEVVATVDSDSVVGPETLTELVSPIVHRPRVGAVAGKVLVHNRRQNLLTRMLGVRYILGFDFIRAYQSTLSTVWCCPGALQAYRRSIIAAHLDAWRDQRFLGARCTNGDDHAMTNLVLSLGYDTTYQSTATVETLVPTTYETLCRMYVRWGRSATREGMRALRFAPHRALDRGVIRGGLILLDALLQPMTIALRVLGLFAGVVLLFHNPALLLIGGLVTTLVALIYCAIHLRSERTIETLFGVLYAWFAMVGLVWVQPFATLTVRGNDWLTR